jgi:hypothetical protein
MKMYYDKSADQFIAENTKTGEAMNEKLELIPIETVLTLLPVAMTFIDWLWVKIFGTKEQRIAAQAWRAARKDKKRKFKLEKLQLKIGAHKHNRPFLKTKNK